MNASARSGEIIMTHGFEVHRDHLKTHAQTINNQQNIWTTNIPGYLSNALPPQDALTLATSATDLFDVLQSIHARYVNDFVPGIASAIFEVSAALSHTVDSYGDAEIANIPESKRSPIMPRRHPGDGSGDIGDILSRPTE
jgi:hypothetical protein